MTRSVVALVALTSIVPGRVSAQPALDPVSLAPSSQGARSPDPRSEFQPPSADPKLPGPPRSGDDPAASDPPPPVLPTAPAPLAIEHAIDPDRYVCGPGDVFELDFWGPQNARVKLATDLEGRAFIAKVGFVTVAGKTLSAVRAAMKSKIRASYPGLTFDVALLAPRSFLVHVVDNVRQPGTYMSRAVDRVSTVIARASMTTGAAATSAATGAGGGMTGSRRRISIRHHDGTTGSADLVRYELTGDVAFNPYLLDGDVITVPFASPVVTISGAVRRPGAYELVAGKDLAELLELAGGFTSGVSRALPIQLIRRDAHQHDVVTELAFAGDAAPSAPLRDDDRIVVRGSEDLRRTVVIIGAVTGADALDSATTSRRIAFADGDTALSLLDRAGGIKAQGDLRRAYISRPRPGKSPALIPLDLEALLVRRDFRADRPIQMDDTIVVPPRQYSVLVEGAVARAGLYSYNPTFGISEYIARAGGRTRTARDLDDAQLIDTDGHTQAFGPGVKPSPGDAILVPERTFSRPEIVQLVLAGAGIVLSGIAVTIAATR